MSGGGATPSWRPSRREALAERRPRLRGRPAGAPLGGRPGVVPDPRGHGLLLGRGPQPRRGAGVRHRRHLVVRDPGPRPRDGCLRLLLPAPGLRDLAAAARASWASSRCWPPAPRPTPTTLPVAAVLGALVPVVAWRIAADVADERSLPAERSRTLALGAGLVAGVTLPLVLPSAHLDSTNAFALPALLACLVMVRLVRRPPERLLDGRLLLLGVLIGIAGLARNEAAWVGLAWALVAAGALRGRGWRPVAGAIIVPAVGGRRRHGPLAGPQLGRLRLPAAGPGDHERLGDHRHGDLRLAAPGDGSRLPGPGTGSLAGSPGGRVRPQPAVRAPGSRRPAGGRGDRRPALGGPVPGAAAPAGPGPDHVPGHDARVPDPDPLGDVPPRVGPGRGAPARGRPCRPRRGPGVGGPPTRLDAPGRLAGPPLRRPGRRPVHGARRHRLRRAGPRHRGRPTWTWPAGWRRPASPSTARRR